MEKKTKKMEMIGILRGRVEVEVEAHHIVHQKAHENLRSIPMGRTTFQGGNLW